MTETPPGNGAQATAAPDPSDKHHGARPGVDTDHLRDYRALRREPHDRKIAGVGGGLARHLDVDPTLVRVVLVVLALFGGAGIILYGALWLFVPERGSESALIPVGESARNAVVVVALILAVLVALPAGLDGDGGVAVPFVVLAIILVAVLMARDSRGSAPPAPGVPPPDPHGGAAAPPGAAGGWSGGDRGGDWGTGTYTTQPAAAPVPPQRTRRGPVLFGTALASLVLALGVLGMVDVSGAAVPDGAYAALALAVTGAWLVVGAFVGRPGGLILLGVAALVALSVTQIAEPTFEGDRELLRRPAQASQLADHYDVPAGRAEIDLTGIRDLEELDGRSLRVDLNAGEIQLVVPDDLSVDLNAEVGAGGEISTPAGTRGGWGVEVDESLDADDPRATLDVDLGVGFGRILVRSEP